MMSKKSYRVYSFQHQGFIDKLLKDGIARTDYWMVNNSGNKKLELYEPLLGDELEEDTVPIYTFLKHNAGFHEYPISAHTLQSSWMEFVGWYRLDGRHLIELEIPAECGVVGGIDSSYKANFEDDTETFLEFVVPYIKLEWVREIYIKDSNNLLSGNTLVEFTPLLNQYEDRLFSCPFIMGSEVRYDLNEICSDDFATMVKHKHINMDDYLVGNKPIKGMSYGYNVSRLTLEKGRELLLNGMKKHFPSINSNDEDKWLKSIRELQDIVYL